MFIPTDAEGALTNEPETLNRSLKSTFGPRLVQIGIHRQAVEKHPQRAGVATESLLATSTTHVPSESRQPRVPLRPKHFLPSIHPVLVSKNATSIQSGRNHSAMPISVGAISSGLKMCEIASFLMSAGRYVHSCLKITKKNG